MNKSIKTHFKQYESFYKLMRSFLIMLILPLLLVIVNYIYSRSLLREENLNYQDAVLQQVQLATDERLQGLQRHALDLTNDSTIRQALEQKLTRQEDWNFQLWQVSNQLQYYIASASSLCDTLVYSTNYDCLISGKYVDYHVSEGMHRVGSEEMNRLVLEKLQNTRAYCQFELLRTELGETQMLLLHTVPLWSTGLAPYGTVCLVVHSDRLFTDILDGEETKAGLFCLLDAQGQVAAWYGNEDLLAAVPEADATQESFQRISGGIHTVTHKASALGGWRYLSIQPEHTMVKKLNRAKNMSLLMLALVLIAGNLIGILLTRRNYMPIKRLMNELRRQSALSKTNPEEISGEFSLIERSMKEVSSSMSALENTIKEEMPRIQESVLMQLFRNAVTDYPRYRNTLERVGILLSYGQFRVALVKRLQEAELDQQLISMLMVKERVIQLTPKSMIYAFATVDDDSLIVLLNGEGERFEAESRGVLDSVAEDMRESYGQMLWISASEVGSGMEYVSRAYYSVMQAHRQAPEGGVQYLEEVNDICAIDKALESLSAQMQNYIATGNEEGALELLHRSLESEVRQKHAALYEARTYFIGVLNIVTGAYRVEDPQVLTVKGEAPLKQLFLLHNTYEMEALLTDLIRSVCGYVRENQQSPTTQLTAQMLDYLQKNYGDVDLTLTSVAEHFCLTPSYLSAFFKSNTGENFLNYLTHLRMEKAKELMRSTNASIRDISEKVGYASANTFTRAFKNAEHITPSQYRESVQGE